MAGHYFRRFSRMWVHYFLSSPSPGLLPHPPMALPDRSTALRQMLVPTRFSPPHPYSLDEGDAKQGGVGPPPCETGREPGWGDPLEVGRVVRSVPTGLCKGLVGSHSRMGLSGRGLFSEP